MTVSIEEARRKIHLTAQHAADFSNFSREQLIAYILLQDKGLMEAGAFAIAHAIPELMTYLYVLSMTQAEFIRTVNSSFE